MDNLGQKTDKAACGRLFCCKTKTTGHAGGYDTNEKRNISSIFLFSVLESAHGASCKSQQNFYQVFDEFSEARVECSSDKKDDEK
ncbi:hypothetical protein [Pyramidobacter sp. C12-8]|uniref:hypothetical protein n=1 Tax=Pyramidobacter sp. C12-8 TaxID=1943580 RepID=UPI00143B84BA|nr:hypothetical protein [Pyramidobacter sp. C12-8]